MVGQSGSVDRSSVRSRVAGLTVLASPAFSRSQIEWYRLTRPSAQVTSSRRASLRTRVTPTSIGQAS